MIDELSCPWPDCTGMFYDPQDYDFALYGFALVKCDECARWVRITETSLDEFTAECEGVGTT